MEMRKKSSTLGKTLTKDTSRKTKQIPSTKQQNTEATAICLNCHTCHVEERNDSQMQFSKCRTKQNNKITRLNEVSLDFIP